VEYYVFSDERGNEGYIDKKGNVVINPQFDYANKFSEGLAAVKIGDKWGYVDKMGKYVINPQFDRAGDFSEGRAAVMMGDKWGYVNKTGKLVINPQFKFADDFLGGWAFVSYESQENENGFRQGYIDKTGASVYTFVSK